ncbi:MAG: hypothetical protein ACYC22_05240 [Thiomonas delicata]
MIPLPRTVIERMGRVLSNARVIEGGCISSELPSVPHMEESGRRLLEARLSESNVYLEYGAGGSTILAAKMAVRKIYSVESDAFYLKKIGMKLANDYHFSGFSPCFVDIGPTKEWGMPINISCASRWPAYCMAGWGEMKAAQCTPDLILVDGRFRVASFLASLIHAKEGVPILFDDYFDRSYSSVVERYIKPHSRAGRMAEFIADKSIHDMGGLVSDLVIAATDPR